MHGIRGTQLAFPGHIVPLLLLLRCMPSVLAIPVGNNSQPLNSTLSEFFRNYTEIESKNGCNDAWLSYLQDKYNFENKFYTTTTGTILTDVQLWETVETLRSGSVYTACDGIPRFRFNTSATSWSVTTKTVRVTAPSATPVVEILSSYPDEKFLTEAITGTPTCSPASSFCDQMWGAVMEYARTPISGFSSIALDPRPCPVGKLCQVLPGNEVVLLYWPSSTRESICSGTGYTVSNMLVATTGPIDGPLVAIVTAVTFRGQDLYWVGSVEGSSTYVTPPTRFSTSVMYGNWTFTSPQIGLAHHPITGMITTMRSAQVMFGWPDSNTTTKLLRTSGVLTINPQDVYSLRPVHFNSKAQGTEYARLIASGEFDPMTPLYGPERFETRQFDFADLIEPIPASNYFDARPDCWNKQTHCGTITDDSYRPVLSLKSSVWFSIFPKDFDCSLPLLQDPNIALRPMASEAFQEVTLPSFPSAMETTQGVVEGAQSTEISTPSPGQMISPSRPVVTNPPETFSDQFMATPGQRNKPVGGRNRGQGSQQNPSATSRLPAPNVKNGGGPGSPQEPGKLDSSGGEDNAVKGTSKGKPVVFSGGSTSLAGSIGSTVLGGMAFALWATLLC